MISYKDNGDFEIHVMFEGKRVGSILSNKISIEGQRFWYKPKNGQPGENFDSLSKVKRSIEFGDD